jgi:hypothetical protein
MDTSIIETSPISISTATFIPREISPITTAKAVNERGSGAIGIDFSWSVQ